MYIGQISGHNLYNPHSNSLSSEYKAFGQTLKKLFSFLDTTMKLVKYQEIERK